MNAPTEKQIALLHHTLGLSERVRVPYRNHFVAGEGHHDQPDLLALEARGLMTRRRLGEVWGGGDCFYATEAGELIAVCNLLPVPKRSKYKDFLDADCGYSFAEFLGIDVPRREYGSIGYQAGKVRLTSQRATGDYCPTLKEAKVSYKAALKAHQQAEREWNAA